MPITIIGHCRPRLQGPVDGSALAPETATGPSPASGTLATAALVGLGRTRRNIVSDTLLSCYSDDEI